MSLTDELRKLQDLHDSGALSEEEFARAKATLLGNPQTPPAQPPAARTDGDALGEAARTWVTFQVVMGCIGLVVAAVVFFAFFLPNWNRAEKRHDQFQQRFEKSWDDAQKKHEQFQKEFDRPSKEGEKRDGLFPKDVEVKWKDFPGR
jgi:Short C-terminal domain